MKKPLLLMFAILMAFGMQQIAAQEIILPFTGKEYRTDAQFFRAKASGKSPDMTIAQNKAIAGAKTQIAGMMETFVQSVVDEYTVQFDVDVQSTFGRVFQEQTKLVVVQLLQNISVMDEKAVQDGNAIQYWVVLEVPKVSLIEKLEAAVEEGFNKIKKSNEEEVTPEVKDKLDLDKDRFEKIFDEEMQKMAE